MISINRTTGAALDRKKTRLFASLAVSAAVVLGASGCAMISPQATTIEYSASDGVNVPNAGPLEVRNAVVIANEDGTLGNLLAAVVNSSDDTQTLTVTDAGTGESLTLRVPARGTVSLGVDEEPLLFEDFNAAPGATVSLAFQSGDASGVELDVPVLDGALEQYADFVPTGR